MADVSAGLSSGDTIDSDADFTEHLARAAGVEVSEETLAHLREGDTSVKGGLTTEESPGQGRDEAGRFSPATPSEEVVPEGAAPAEEEVENDPLADQLKEAQKFIGEQSATVGELRERLAKLEGAAEERARTPQQPAQAPLPPVARDSVAEAVADRDGPAVINDLANLGYTDGHPAYDYAFEAWMAQDDTGAAEAAYVRYRVELANPSTPATARAATEDPWVAQKKAQEQFDGTLGQVAQGFGTEWGAIAPHLEAALEDAALPALIRNSLSSSDPTTLREGLQSLALIARSRAVAEATAAAAEEHKQAVLGTKKAAQVATGSFRPAADGSPTSGEGLSTEERTRIFHERLLAAETTSVRDGITTG